MEQLTPILQYAFPRYKAFIVFEEIQSLVHHPMATNGTEKHNSEEG